MSRFYASSMASEVATHPDIAIVKSFFGLRTKAVYKPTKSSVESYANTYDEKSGKYYEHLFSLSVDELKETLDKSDVYDYLEGDAYEMQLCISNDHEFVALRVVDSSDDNSSKNAEVHYYTGDVARKITEIL